ncbi:hypothetical protein SteCoe_1646 [Stentor coeruleus]|uniref:Uncharacterized protein n=1 Tax=Stentor coeruleus TaxID=5963 RepID=A0A1R2D1H2_9CILI|nr:hypothetical protein SteCoe_1646 [Stentor coeruleus]
MKQTFSHLPCITHKSSSTRNSPAPVSHFDDPFKDILALGTLKPLVYRNKNTIKPPINRIAFPTIIQKTQLELEKISSEKYLKTKEKFYRYHSRSPKGTIKENERLDTPRFLVAREKRQEISFGEKDAFYLS